MRKTIPVYNTAEEFPHPKDWMTLKEVSEAIGISVASLKLYINQGKLGAFRKQWRYGRYIRVAWYVPVEEMKRYMAKRAVGRYLKGHSSTEWWPPNKEEM